MDAVGWKHPVRKCIEVSVWEPSDEKPRMMVPLGVKSDAVRHDAQKKVQKENF